MEWEEMIQLEVNERGHEDEIEQIHWSNDEDEILPMHDDSMLPADNDGDSEDEYWRDDAIPYIPEDLDNPESAHDPHVEEERREGILSMAH
ncbi:hypothetical protein SCP_1100490 [Sparassis crispa]|uniref:Uncharacterized protein n=1 Tax=Sparassis crispa TaxID=139825 RepID=A0A401GYZ1_9APHY|nr:hypothetical protein SCP_1100490 [Sparassis crispa]GBE87374.1 hypothetical protein SCP_1100490 [Sparassis crispa]